MPRLNTVDPEGRRSQGRVVVTDDAGGPAAEITGNLRQRVQRRTVPPPLSQKVFDTSWVGPQPGRRRITRPAAGWC